MNARGSSETLRNLGPKSRSWLAEVGIENRADLARVGIIEAYCLVAERRPVSLVLLWALWGALHDQDWREVPEPTKIALKNQLK